AAASTGRGRSGSGCYASTRSGGWQPPCTCTGAAGSRRSPITMATRGLRSGWNSNSEETTMASATVGELRKKTDAAWANLERQLQGMEPHMERSDSPGEWTTRQVLSHRLFEPGWKPVPVLDHR